MTPIEKARAILANAENSLRELVAQTAADGDYEAVVALTAWAKSINSLTKSVETGGSPEPSMRNGQSLPLPSLQKNARARKRKYPQFFRHGDSLVKVAWSKSSKSEYEHRCPWTIVQGLAAAVLEAGEQSLLFSMDDVLPLMDANGEEVPSYRAYLCLAWLRDVELVRQHGRQGYSIDPGCDFTRDLEAAWGKLAKRIKT